jgi:hypothetical protein
MIKWEIELRPYETERQAAGSFSLLCPGFLRCHWVLNANLDQFIIIIIHPLVKQLLRPHGINIIDVLSAY